MAIRGEGVARLFRVSTARLNEQVARNEDKFGDDFAFQMSPAEWTDLKSQFATSTATSHGTTETALDLTDHWVGRPLRTKSTTRRPAIPLRRAPVRTDRRSS
jgi:hypothetical protein